MATVLFDFDSTLVPVESLELVLEAALGGDSARLAAVEALTRRGMEGEIDFRTSLTSRLALATPTLDDVRAVAERLSGMVTDGCGEVVAGLLAEGHGVRIVSGGFRDVILPTARRLGLRDADVHAVSVRWSAAGTFEGLVHDGFSASKVEGVRRLSPAWERPVVAVGDGATDLALATAGVADRFVAFTEHERRAFLDEADVPQAGSMAQLGSILLDILQPGHD